MIHLNYILLLFLLILFFTQICYYCNKSENFKEYFKILTPKKEEVRSGYIIRKMKPV